jgi:hypothetical protein
MQIVSDPISIILNHGEDFVGHDAASLAYRTHTVERADNVKYELESDIPF